MAIVSGVLGTITLNKASTGLNAAGQSTSNLHVSGWTLNLSQDMLEVTSWDNASNAREYIGGMSTGTGTATVLYDSGQAIDHASTGNITVLNEENKAPASFVLTATTARTYTFDGLVSGFSITSEKAGLYQGTVDIQVSSDVTTA
jgi:predicted secreted protein